MPQPEWREGARSMGRQILFNRCRPLNERRKICIFGGTTRFFDASFRQWPIRV
jgi:hypothetical protein